MTPRFLSLALLCLVASADALAQPPKSSDKGGEKKAPAPKGPADLAFDEFNKARNDPGPKDQARFQKVIVAGLTYLTQNPTHNRVNDVVRELAFYATTIDKKQAALRTSYLSNLRLELTNLRFKEGVSEPVMAVLAAVDVASVDYETREMFNRDVLVTLREKLDDLTKMPGSGRFLVDRERSYTHILALGPSAARAEEHLKKLLDHPEKPVAAMAREELTIFETRKTPLALKFTALDGKEVDLEQLRGKVVGLYFFSTTNKQSTDRFEPMKQFAADYKKRGFELVTVSYDKEEDRAKLTQFIKENKLPWPVHFDGKGAKTDLAAKLNATGVPRMYILDQKGVLQTAVHGTPLVRITADTPLNLLEFQVKKLLGIK
jgi:peroxiredoxin